MDSPHILSFFITLGLLPALGNPYLIHQFCESTEHYTKTTTYRTNLNYLFSSLTLKTPKSGFSTAIAGTPLHRVYGLALCRGDIDHDNCTSCLYKASRHIVRLCPNPNGGIAWYDDCAVRYSIHNFVSQLHTPKDYFAQCLQAGMTNRFEFENLLVSMMESISEIAAFNASVRMFATGVNAQAYGLVQCTRDLSKSDCFKCLNQTFNTLFQGCGSSFLGTAVKWNCIVMYANSRIFKSNPTWVGLPELHRMELAPAPSVLPYRSEMSN